MFNFLNAINMIVFENTEEFTKAVSVVIDKIIDDKNRQNKLNQLFTKKDVAKMLGIGYTKIQTLIRNGFLITTQDGAFITNKSIKEYTQTH